MSSPVTRTRATVEREYGEEKWPAMLRLVEQERDAEPGAGLARVLGRVARSQWRREDPLATRPSTVGGAQVPLAPSASYGAIQGLLLELVQSACTDDTGLVIELGSGWGWHILTLWARGGPRAARYVAAEYTEAGRRAAARLAELDEHLDFRAVAFDYHEPALPDLAPAEHAVVFTAHSIEQIPHVVPELFTAIRGLGRRVTCLHFEPVGWQVDGHDGRGTSEAYATEHDYNRNLVASVRAEEAAGRLVVDAVVPDVLGINPRNSTTLVQWHAEAP
jgi:hypothetical protein